MHSARFQSRPRRLFTNLLECGSPADQSGKGPDVPFVLDASATSMMPTPECPVEFALWWSERFLRMDPSAWAPRIDQLELFESVCQLRVQFWTRHLGSAKTTKWKILEMLSTSDPPMRQEAIRDVLVHEPLLRILAASAKSIRAREIRDRVRPIFHEAFVSIRQVRCLALEQLVLELDRGSLWARTLNRLRISIEQWTDMLLGNCASKLHVPVASLYEYGFRAPRIDEFAYESNGSNQKLSGMLQGWLLVQGLRRTMRAFGPHLALQPTQDAHLRQLATDFLMPKSFLEASATDSLQIDQRFDLIEHWCSLLEEPSHRVG